RRRAGPAGGGATVVMCNEDRTVERMQGPGGDLHLVEASAGPDLPRREWGYVGRAGDRHAWAGPCGCCGRPATVRVDEAAVLQVWRELETFGALECAACSADRMHEFDHIVRSAPPSARGPFLDDAPLAGSLRSLDQERGYREWCARRGLEPLPPVQPAGRWSPRRRQRGGREAVPGESVRSEGLPLNLK
ncbi:MAG: hypothetical protein ACRDKW_08470, partial [Actinomycetota bacterium]